MKINKVKCYQFNNYILMSLQHQKVSSSCVCDIRSVKVHWGQLQKSQLNIHFSFGWNFQKLKAERKLKDMLMFPNPLRHLQLQYQALRTKASVESLFGLKGGGFKIKNMQMSFQNEMNSLKKTYELSCVKL